MFCICIISVSVVRKLSKDIMGKLFVTNGQLETQFHIGLVIWKVIFSKEPSLQTISSIQETSYYRLSEIMYLHCISISK